MKEIAVTGQITDTPLDGYLFHQSGEILGRPGEKLDSAHLAMLRDCDIGTVIFTEATADPAAIKNALCRKRIALDAIPLGEPIPVTLFDNAGTVVVSKGETLIPGWQNELAGRGITTLSYNKDPLELQRFQIDRYHLLLNSEHFESFNIITTTGHSPKKDAAAVTRNGPQGEPIPESRFFTNPARMMSLISCKDIMLHPDILAVAVPDGATQRPVSKIITGRTRESILEYGHWYASWMTSLDGVFGCLKNNREVSFNVLDIIASDIVECCYNDCYYALNLMNLRYPPASDRYLQTHSINVAIASAGLGIRLGYTGGLLRELVVGALLHDIGHILTHWSLFSKKQLDAEEQKQYDNHVIIGITLLKNVTKVPISTLMAVTQHHEHLDGSGRIFHVAASKIHTFAKIIAVADCFENKCRFLGSSTAIAATVADANEGRIDFKYVRELVVLLSLYPVGIAVRTSDDIVCKVIATNEDAYKTPVLKSLFTLRDYHLLPVEKKQVLDMARTNIIISEEVAQSTLKTDISAGFYDD